MNTTTYTVSATPSPFGGTKTKSQSITGTNNVTFDLGGLSAYDSMAGGNFRVNKVIVDFDDGEELVINRPLSATGIPTLSAEASTLKRYVSVCSPLTTNLNLLFVHL